MINVKQYDDLITAIKSSGLVLPEDIPNIDNYSEGEESEFEGGFLSSIFFENQSIGTMLPSEIYEDSAGVYLDIVKGFFDYVKGEIEPEELEASYDEDTSTERISCNIAGEKYRWSVVVDEYLCHDFIRTVISDINKHVEGSLVVHYDGTEDVPTLYLPKSVYESLEPYFGCLLK